MSYLDIMSDAAYGRYNRKLAGLVGLGPAVYWSEVLDIIGHVVKKKAFDKDGYMTIDREYVKERTGLSILEQKECEESLIQLGVMGVHPTDQNKIGVMCREMYELLTGMNPTEDHRPKPKKVTLSKAEKAEGKRIGITGYLKEQLVEDDQDLRTAYCGWIDVAYDKGIVRSAQVKVFQDAINAYTDDRQAKLEIINICISLSYRDAKWGIQRYEERHKKDGVVRLPQQKIATKDSIDTSVKF